MGILKKYFLSLSLQVQNWWISTTNDVLQPKGTFVKVGVASKEALKNSKTNCIPN